MTKKDIIHRENFDFFSPEAAKKRSDDSGIDCSYEAQKAIYEAQGLEVNPEKPGNVCRAQQSMGEEHNIVNLVDHLVKHGVGVETPVPIHTDLESYIDFHTAMNQVRQAEMDFLQLPADVS